MSTVCCASPAYLKHMELRAGLKTCPLTDASRSFRIAPGEPSTAEQAPISVLYPQSRHLAAKVRIFVDWVSELIQQDPMFQKC